MSAEQDGQDLARTPLFSSHRELGARIVPFAGFEMPVLYDNIVKEHHAVRKAVGLFDVSHMGELELEGPAALAVADSLVTNAVGKLEVGQALYTVCCNAEGRILDDLIVYRRGEQRILIVCNASNRDKIAPHVASHAAQHDGCEFRDLSDDTALLALQGPGAEALMNKVGGQTFAQLGFFRLAEGTLLGHECIVARTGYTGEDGFEIFCPNGAAMAIWTALIDGGAKPIGLGARDTLRLEAKLCLYGNDIDETTHPYEAGLGWVVKLDTDFVGRDALAKIKEAPLERKLVGFEMVGRGIARAGCDVVDADGTVIGRVTSGSPSPTLGKNIGLAYVPRALAKSGTPLVVDIRGKRVEAVVVKTPFYKRPRT